MQTKGWQALHIRREYSFTNGRKLFGGLRGERCRVVYLLIYQNTFIGIIEAKSEDKELTLGLQQPIYFEQKQRVWLIY